MVQQKQQLQKQQETGLSCVLMLGWENIANDQYIQTHDGLIHNGMKLKIEIIQMKSLDLDSHSHRLTWKVYKH